MRKMLPGPLGVLNGSHLSKHYYEGRLLSLPLPSHTLFEQTEELAALRHRLSEILASNVAPGDEILVTFALKEIDLVRISLLYEYELLDTSHIISAEYLTSYYARRIDIARMTVAQIQGHNKELHALVGQVAHGEARGAIEKGAESMEKAIQLLNNVIEQLEQHIIGEKNKEIIH